MVVEELEEQKVEVVRPGRLETMIKRCILS